MIRKKYLHGKNNNKYVLKIQKLKMQTCFISRFKAVTQTKYGLRMSIVLIALFLIKLNISVSQRGFKFVLVETKFNTNTLILLK